LRHPFDHAVTAKIVSLLERITLNIEELDKKWDKLMKDIKGSVPVDKDMVSELAGIQGALDKLGSAKTRVDKACDEMRKGLVLAMSAVKILDKELVSFAAASKKAGKEQTLTKETDKQLEAYSKVAEGLRDALSNYEK
jgi:ribosome-binding ATPase YchF (GTP1/OBG family)